MLKVEGLDTKGNIVEIKGVYEEDASTLWISATMLGLVRLKVDFSGDHVRVISQEEKTIKTRKMRFVLFSFLWLIREIPYYGWVIEEKGLSDII